MVRDTIADPRFASALNKIGQAGGERYDSYEPIIMHVGALLRPLYWLTKTCWSILYGPGVSQIGNRY